MHITSGIFGGIDISVSSTLVFCPLQIWDLFPLRSTLISASNVGRQHAPFKTNLATRDTNLG